MKFFLDTANLADIRWASRAGLIDGITTNPTLLARSGVSPMNYLSKILPKERYYDQAKEEFMSSE